MNILTVIGLGVAALLGAIILVRWIEWGIKWHRYRQRRAIKSQPVKFYQRLFSQRVQRRPKSN